MDIEDVPSIASVRWHSLDKDLHARLAAVANAES